MKKILLACLLFTGWSQAQNITFKDPAFKNYLINLNYYDNSNNSIKLDENNDSEISYDEAKKPTSININDDNIQSIEEIENFINIVSFNTEKASKISSIDLTQLLNLKVVSLSGLNELTFFKSSRSLENLNIDGTLDNNINPQNVALFNKIDFNEYPNLKRIYFNNFRFNSNKFDFSSNLKLETIDIYNFKSNIQTSLITPKNLNGINIAYISTPFSVDLNNSIELQNIDIQYVNISNIDLSKNIKLKSFSTSSINISTLDVSNQNLNVLRLYNSKDLSSIFLKNNFKTEALAFYELPSLKYICADNSEMKIILDSLLLTGINNVEVNNYCSFTPGGEYNTITNNVKFDSNGDCSRNDKYLNYTKFSIEDQNVIGYSATDKDGIVQFYKQKGNYTLNPLLENPTYFKISPQTVNFNLVDNSGHDTTINFCITPNGIHKDLEVILSPYGPARPGFDATYLVTYKNKGNQTLSGDVSVQYNEDVLDFVRSTMSTQTSGLVSTSFIDLKPFEVKVDTLVLNVNSPIESPAVNINDTLKFIATINTTNEDETPEDNVFAFNQRVVGAYDPNLITCLEGNVLKPTEIGKTLHYTIEFENTGNYPAENIVVVEEIDPTKYDINSIQILNTSHPMKLRIVGKKVEYYFENIDLGEHKHGNILLKLQGLKNLNEGDTVSKQADIYFDYNAPVQTNDETTVYRDLKASIATLKEDISINVYPNPGNGMVHIEAAKNIKSLDIYDVNGRVIQSKLINTNATAFNLSEEITGIYFIKVISEEGAKVIKYQKD